MVSYWTGIQRTSVFCPRTIHLCVVCWWVLVHPGRPFRRDQTGQNVEGPMPQQLSRCRHRVVAFVVVVFRNWGQSWRSFISAVSQRVEVADFIDTTEVGAGRFSLHSHVADYPNNPCMFVSAVASCKSNANWIWSLACSLLCPPLKNCSNETRIFLRTPASTIHAWAQVL